MSKASTLWCAAAILLTGAPSAMSLEKPDSLPANEGGGEKVKPRAHERGESDGRRPSDGRKGKDKRRGPDFKALDADQDGALNFEEFSSSERLAQLDEEKRRRLFNFLDRNKDGKVQQSELKPRAPHWLTGLAKDFNELDADKNGTLALDEFSKAKGLEKKEAAELEKSFQRLDRNKDGMLQRSELKSHLGSRPRPEMDFKKFDTNQSGGLDYEEYSKLPFVVRFPDDRRQKHFKRIDSDGNGELSPAEIHDAHKRHHGSPRGDRERPHDRPSDGARRKGGKESPGERRSPKEDK
ncbi:hypothetical protein NT6N_05750 [Oceaniferula spumae]|uniref:EF-hand domain-containing protein n=1 Tax=Oceaniferula spumae TaxID=2979115 RepID=A0AAT9FHV1_9BACT